ncbi:hypothetical protein [Pelagicoccus sp. SDUM812005]|uniref:hypothetical protein n=1 Tax=Pelagicoccus sp. SDUM812005 TaxID=3041257 RepID=UPI00280FF961|nr:hypothetical protein [Pelagicoccus sp. SDUM812005]MDQ8183829.1 hypothetical protein [Pelagicoccus sp. SDUM812005]
MKKRMITISLATIAGLALVTLLWPRSIVNSEELKFIDPSDGIDEKEASILADAFFYKFYGACGGTSLKNETDKHWEFDILFGFAAEKLKNPLIVWKDGSHIGASYAPSVDYEFGSWRYSLFDYIRRDPVQHMKDLREEREANQSAHTTPASAPR